MSTNWPAVSNRPSMSRRLRPLSMTWVTPTSRGFPGRAGTPRKPSLKSGIELLQLRFRAVLDVVVEGVAVGVDADGEWAEVFDAELTEALRHQVFPGNLFDLLDLGRLERGGAADDREVDHPEPLHRLDRLVGEAALAADRADAVALAEPLGEAHHPRAGGGADADLLVPARPELAHVGRGVEQERAAQVHRRRGALVEDADLGAVADPDDVTLDDDLVAGTQLQDRRRIGDGEGDLVHRHQTRRSLREPAARAASVLRTARLARAPARVPPPWVG